MVLKYGYLTNFLHGGIVGWHYVYSLLDPGGIDPKDLNSFIQFLWFHRENINVLSIIACIYLLGIFVPEDRTYATDLMNKIDRMDPNHAGNKLNWASAYISDQFKYKIDFKMVLEFTMDAAHSGNPRAMYHLAQYYQKIGNEEEACHWYYILANIGDFHSLLYMIERSVAREEKDNVRFWYMKALNFNEDPRKEKIIDRASQLPLGITKAIINMIENEIDRYNILHRAKMYANAQNYLPFIPTDLLKLISEY